jgi:spermidine/putrescine transport system permease protein
MTRRRISPEINAVSTIMFVAILVLLIIINVRSTSDSKKKKS